MSDLKDMVGIRFGPLVVLRRAGVGSCRQATWVCRCECGNEVVRGGVNLRRNGSSGCDSCVRALTNKASLVHGGASRQENGLATRLYNIWAGMIHRCRKASFKYYAAKGIKVCEEWRSFEAFRDWALSHGYSESLTIDRVDPAWHYEPGNCEWITMEENTRRCHLPGLYWRSLTLTA